MTEFHFANPGFLLLLLALPVLALALKNTEKKAKNRLLEFLHEENLRRLLVVHKGKVEKSKKLALWAGFALFVLALARPQANPTVEEVQSSGLDIYVLMDVSKSMDAEDVAPSRLKKAKRTVQHLASLLAGDRIGIIAFAQSSVLVSPLTNDHSIIESYLQNIDTSIVPSQGTNIGSALETARDAMERGAKNGSKSEAHTNVFLILSDGEAHGESDLSIVDAIQKEGGLIFTVGIGTEKGAPIPIRDENGELRGYKKDFSDAVVVSSVQTDVLKQIARRGGGQFYHSTQDEAEVEDILARVNDAQRGSITTIRTTVWEEFYWLFLAPGLIFLLLSLVPLAAFSFPFPNKISLKKYVSSSSVVMILLFPLEEAHAGILSFFWNKERKASVESQQLAQEKKFADAADKLKPLQAENPDNPELNYNIGTYLLLDKKAQGGREQLSHLRNADGILRDLALFNTGGSFAQEGKKAEARAAYAELIQHLNQKQKLNETESSLLAQTKRNLARLADPSQQPQSDQKQQQEQQKDQQNKKEGSSDHKNPDSQKGEGEKEKNQSSDQKKSPDGDAKGNEQKNAQGGNPKEDNKEEKGANSEKKEPQKENEGDQKEQRKNRQDARAPVRGSQPFKERDDMGEEEAKRILGALREQESDLQKKFLKNKIRGGKVNSHDAAKDW